MGIQDNSSMEKHISKKEKKRKHKSDGDIEKAHKKKTGLSDPVVTKSDKKSHKVYQSQAVAPPKYLTPETVDLSDSEDDENELWLIKVPSHISAQSLTKLELPCNLAHNFSADVKIGKNEIFKMALINEKALEGCSDKELEYFNCLLPVLSEDNETCYKMADTKISKYFTLKPLLSLPNSNTLREKAAAKMSI